ncbi:MAG: RHS repeat-associated core domain-containing protein, partial [Myxococcota bacterium]
MASKQGTSTQSKAYTYDALNRLTTVSGGSYSIAYDYDKNGNMLRKTDSREPTPVYSVYNARNKLVQMYKGDGATGEPQAQFDYNDDGLRTLYRYSDRGDVKYVYDESSVIDEYYENGGDLLAHYTYGDRLIALDTPVTPGSTTLKRQYYHHDALGSTVGLTDEAGAVIAGYKLDPWGNIREQTGTTQNRNIFTGHAFDNSTGLYYFKARYYDAELPRFTTQDTYLGEEGTPPSLNRYLYAYSNPTVWVDPTGHEPFSPHEREAITDKAQSVGEYNQSHTDELSA